MGRTGFPNSTPLSMTSSRYQLCPTCGSFGPYAKRVNFCIVCGSRLLDECPQCHKHIVFPTGKFCPACGEALVIGKE